MERSHLIQTRGVWALCGLGIVAAATAVFIPPIGQPPDYHDFADQRSLFGIPHGFNVLSNIFFVSLGWLGLRRGHSWPFRVLFGGVFFTAFGSAFYHLAPDDFRLVFDRLPLAIVFMSFFAIVISERVEFHAGRRMFWPCVLFGVLSVLYWRNTGDLRLYALAQFLPLALVPVVLVLFRRAYTRDNDYWVVLGCYLLAKLFEISDRQVYSMGEIVSGHTLKHLAAAFGAYWLLRMLSLRRALPR